MASTKEKDQRIVRGASMVSSSLAAWASSETTAQNTKFSAWQDGMNSAILKRNANEIVRVGSEQKSQIISEGQKIKAEQIQGVVKSGASVAGGDTAAIVNETSYQVAREVASIELNAEMKKNNANKQASVLEIQEKFKNKSAKAALLAARVGAMNGFAQGGYNIVRGDE